MQVDLNTSNKTQLNVPTVLLDVLTNNIMEVAMAAIPCMCHFDSISTRHFSVGSACPGCATKITKLCLDGPTQSFIDLWFKLQKSKISTNVDLDGEKLILGVHSDDEFDKRELPGVTEHGKIGTGNSIPVGIPTVFINTPYHSVIMKTMAMVPCMCRFDSTNEIYLPKCFKCKNEIKEIHPDPYFDRLLKIWKDSLPPNLIVEVPRLTNISRTRISSLTRLVWTPIELPLHFNDVALSQEIIDEKCIPLLRHEINQALFIWGRCTYLGLSNQHKIEETLAEGIILRLNKLKDTMDLPIIDKVKSFISERKGQQFSYLMPKIYEPTLFSEVAKTLVTLPSKVFLVNNNSEYWRTERENDSENHELKMNKFIYKILIKSGTTIINPALRRMINTAIVLFNNRLIKNISDDAAWEAFYLITVLRSRYKSSLLTGYQMLMGTLKDRNIPLLKKSVSDYFPSNITDDLLLTSITHIPGNKRKATEEVVIDEDMENQLVAIAKKHATNKNHSAQNDECAVM